MTRTTKCSKMGINRGSAIEYLKRSPIVKNGSGKPIDKICSSQNTISPKKLGDLD